MTSTRIFQRLLFVGLGGSGCSVGAELERSLRQAFCGPDGKDLLNKGGQFSGLLPYQLPNFLRFVYADFDQKSIRDLRGTTGAPGPVAALSAKYLDNIAPTGSMSYPEAAENLRAGASGRPGSTGVETWLPKRSELEPRVTPLTAGAGQFPTVGRAALAESLRVSGLQLVRKPIETAISEIMNATAELTFVRDGQPAANGCDVFVAFSIAGGTGAGIFLDFLYLIESLFAANQPDIPLQIFPLVIMPSGFDQQIPASKLHDARLNGARAVEDLLRLVDRQNQAVVQEPIMLPNGVGQPLEKIVMREGKVRTAFLFSKPSNLGSRDLHRSIVSFAMSLISTEAEGADKSGQQHMSFASKFVNDAGDLAKPGQGGVGLSGASTAFSASISVPIHRIARLLAEKLVADAVGVWDRPVAGETNAERGRAFIDSVGLRSFRDCAPLEPLPAIDTEVRGAEEVTAELMRHGEIVNAQIAQHEREVTTNLVPRIINDIDYRGAVRAALPATNPFRLRRVVFGHPQLETVHDQKGFLGWITGVGAARDINVSRPDLSQLQLRDRALGIVKVKISDPEVTGFLVDTQNWYEVSCKMRWHAAWLKQQPYWMPRIEQLRSYVNDLASDFRRMASEQPGRYKEECADLYARRVGVGYLVPDGGMAANLDQFDLRIRTHLCRELAISEASDAATIVDALLGANAWSRLVDADRPVEALITYVQERMEIEMTRRIPGTIPLLPSLEDLLTEASNPDSMVDSDWKQRLISELAGLLPPGVSPDGSAQLRVLVNYPSAGRNVSVENFLIQMLRNSSQETGALPELYPSAMPTLTVTQSRGAMSSTEIREIRKLRLEWDQGLRDPLPTDLVTWRQRTGFDFSWRFTTESDRSLILHALLNALWSGNVRIEGNIESPDAVHLLHPKSNTATLCLELETFRRGLSRWGGFLFAYERLLLDASEAQLLQCQEFVRHIPRGVVTGELEDPAQFYEVFLQAANADIDQLRTIAGSGDEGTGAQGKANSWIEIWTRTINSALERPFSGANLNYTNHLEMRRAVGRT